MVATGTSSLTGRSTRSWWGTATAKTWATSTSWSRRSATLGMLQPITISPDGTLICGARRLEAAKRLGMRHVNVWVRVGDLHQAAAAAGRAARQRHPQAVHPDRGRRAVPRAQEPDRRGRRTPPARHPLRRRNRRNRRSRRWCRIGTTVTAGTIAGAGGAAGDRPQLLHDAGAGQRSSSASPPTPLPPTRSARLRRPRWPASTPTARCTPTTSSTGRPRPHTADARRAAANAERSRRGGTGCARSC